MGRAHRFLFAAVLTGCSASEVEALHADNTVAGGKADDVSDALGGPLPFEHACDDGASITIAAVGDILLHSPLQRQAYADEDGFLSLWNGVADLLAAADVTYANLEGPAAYGVDTSGRDVPDPGKVFDGTVYSSYPQFNYHPSLAADLVATGVDVVSTANNHSLDRRSLGADRTIEALTEAGLPFTGTRRSDGGGTWHTYTEAGGFRLAWVACTFSTNGIPDPDDQVLMCYEDEEEVLDLIASLAAEPDVDAVIATPHWGVEYTHVPRGQEIGLAHRMVDAGAVAVLGAHPHVVQPWERYVTDGGREGFIIYSLGNFVSNQSQLPRRSTILLYVGLKRTADGVVPYGARYVPLHLDRSNGRRELEAVDRVGGPADSRALTVGLFGPWGLAPPVADPDLVPHCDPDYVPPHPSDGWIGGACADVGDDACGGTQCEPQLPGGMCTQPCEHLCPDAAGRPGTLCVDIDGLGPRCVLQCEEQADCREGYTCTPHARPDGSGATDVCFPTGP